MSGKQQINTEEMRACTQYSGGYSDDSPPIDLFWAAMRSLPVKLISLDSETPADSTGT